MNKNPKQCGGKNCYDKKGATTAMNYFWDTEKKELRIYECPTCGYWHLTHNLHYKKEYERKKIYK